MSYYIGVDPKGIPFIAHASGATRKHKYIAKIENSNGVRYFYNEEELEAFKQRKSLDDKHRAAFHESIDKYTGERDNNKLHTDSQTGEHYRAGHSLQKEGNAEHALRDAEKSLREATTVDDKRRAASEKRMAENEYNGLRGTFEDWRRDYRFYKAAREKGKHRSGKF